jgi:aryl-alcohol dehydrogenase-like predicted oxidoreductase
VRWGWTPLIALQVEYSLMARTVESELAPLAQLRGMALVPWGPLKSGFLSGKYRRGAEVIDSERAAFIGTRAMLQFAGATVDGETSTVCPPLLASDVRY